MTTYTLKETGINSPSLHNNIRDFIEEGLEHGGVQWANEHHRVSFGDVIDNWLFELCDDDKIEQWNVVCDKRNNTTKNMANGYFIFTVKYKQRHCVNVTTITYSIDVNSSPEDISFG